MLAQTISAPAISFFISPHPADLRGIAAAPIAEDQARKCELGHTYVGLSKKQRLTELCCKIDARLGCGDTGSKSATRRSLSILGFLYPHKLPVEPHEAFGRLGRLRRQ